MIDLIEDNAFGLLAVCGCGQSPGDLGSTLHVWQQRQQEPKISLLERSDLARAENGETDGLFRILRQHADAAVKNSLRPQNVGIELRPNERRCRYEGIRGKRHS